MVSAFLIDRVKQIKLVVFDVDGVLTDGGLILGDGGEEHKIFHVRDGLGLQLLQQSGCRVAVISGRSSHVVTERMAALGIELIYQGRDDKAKTLYELLATVKIGADATAYVGDDVIDLPAMRRVGLAIAVADAHPLVIKRAHWVTTNKGGRGAAREVCELIMRVHGTLDKQLEPFLK